MELLINVINDTSQDLFYIKLPFFLMKKWKKNYELANYYANEGQKKEEKLIRIGTRNSPLALRQAQILVESINQLGRQLGRDMACDIVPIITEGDKKLETALSEIGGKGLFTRELDNMLINGEIDCAIHSMKDLETSLNPALYIGAVLARDDIRDCLISPLYKNINKIPTGAAFGTASLRRAAQVKLLRPDLDIKLIRGNIQTRIQKCHDGLVAGTMLALAGLNRMAMQADADQIFNPGEIIPAVAQGALAVVAPKHNQAMAEILPLINHQPTQMATQCERLFLHHLDGSCKTPIGGYATLHGDNITLYGFLSRPDLSKQARAEKSGHSKDWQAIATALAQELKDLVQ